MANICVTGSRHWKNATIIDAMVQIHLRADHRHRLHVGDARGADAIARTTADVMGQLGEVYRAAWDQQGKAAGMIRNIAMLEAAQPVLLLAFRIPDAPSGSRGTDGCIAEARRRGIPVIVVEAPMCLVGA